MHVRYRRHRPARSRTIDSTGGSGWLDARRGGARSSGGSVIDGSQAGGRHDAPGFERRSSVRSVLHPGLRAIHVVAAAQKDAARWQAFRRVPRRRADIIVQAEATRLAFRFAGGTDPRLGAALATPRWQELERERVGFVPRDRNLRRVRCQREPQVRTGEHDRAVSLAHHPALR